MCSVNAEKHTVNSGHEVDWPSATVVGSCVKLSTSEHTWSCGVSTRSKPPQHRTRAPRFYLLGFIEQSVSILPSCLLILLTIKLIHLIWFDLIWFDLFNTSSCWLHVVTATLLSHPQWWWRLYWHQNVELVNCSCRLETTPDQPYICMHTESMTYCSG